MTPQLTSVIVVSRQRPAWLNRCLCALAEVEGCRIELIVVACPAGVVVARAHMMAANLTCVPFDAPNIAVARNLGIAHARGDIIAFLDDDAVPEPTWLQHLTGVFVDPEVMLAGGTVLGRNGISQQWGARRLDAWGRSGQTGAALRTEGTNMALRRDVFERIGGFDPAFAFFHDDADLNWRAMQAGFQTQFVPTAVVHHGMAASALRNSQRVPRDLSRIATSQMYFLRKHCPIPERQAAWTDFERAQDQRLIRLLKLGAIGPEEVVNLRKSLDLGRRRGADLPLVSPPGIETASGKLAGPLLPDRPLARRVLLVGWAWQRSNLETAAREHHTQNRHVTVLRLSPSAVFHRMRFVEGLGWLQTGGLWGRSLRTDPMMRFCTAKDRIIREARRISRTRGDQHRFEVTCVDM